MLIPNKSEITQYHSIMKKIKKEIEIKIFSCYNNTKQMYYCVWICETLKKEYLYMDKPYFLKTFNIQNVNFY